jgi:hypothetical protein
VWAEAEAPAAEEAAPPSPEPGPRTWASMASKARPESKEAPAASQAPSRPPARGGPASRGRGTPVAASPRNDRFGKEDSKMGSDAQQIFVGNVPHECSEDHLAEVFGKYGKVGRSLSGLVTPWSTGHSRQDQPEDGWPRGPGGAGRQAGQLRLQHRLRRFRLGGGGGASTGRPACLPGGRPQVAHTTYCFSSLSKKVYLSIFGQS